MRISRLSGLVRDESGCVFGLLLSYVQSQACTLWCAERPETPRDLRQRWVSQIKHMLDQLHKAGIIWGDVKPDNILIDDDQNAWLIDFGGGYTEGWVEKELAGTVEGDLNGLAKILEYLATDLTPSDA